MLVIRNADNVL